jgi:ribonuclease P protein component
MRARPEGESRAVGPRFGFTITKKIGNAVTRNRIRRRLKAAFAARAKKFAHASCDYVIVARPPALDRPFALLLEDVTDAFAALHRAGSKHSAAGPRSSRSCAADKKGSA